MEKEEIEQTSNKSASDIEITCWVVSRKLV